jgi:hypothetical protein
MQLDFSPLFPEWHPHFIDHIWSLTIDQIWQSAIIPSKRKTVGEIER